MSVRRFGLSNPALAMGAGIAMLSMSAAAQADWLSTATKAHSLQNAAAPRALADAAVLHVTVALQLRNESQLDQFLARRGNPLDSLYRATLSNAELTADYAPSAQQAQAVAGYLARAGFSNIRVAPNNLLVSADGSARAAEAAFNTTLRQFELNGRTVFANTADAQVPDSLAGTVLSVLGLQNVDQMQPLIVHAAATTDAASSTGHVPTAFPSIYDALNVTPSAAINVGIITDGNLTQTVADLATYDGQNKLTPPTLAYVPAEVNGTDTSGIDEWDLDSQTVTSMAGSAIGTLYFFNAASLTDADLTTDFNQVLSEPGVSAINVSLGECESGANSDGSMAADDKIFKLAAAQGQTFFAASGDGGADTGCDSQRGLVESVSYPASSPWVVSVGGTTLTTNGNSWAGETAWSDSGGGTSKYETAQSWQSSATGSTKREVPDVAMDANPNSGAIIIVDGASEQVGGTSLATPLATGSWTRVESAHGVSLGFAASPIYAAVGKSPTPYHDVTSGGNGLLGTGLFGYKAGPGYDEVTGWGTFDVGNFSSVVQ
jgi:pseudomonalisin